MNKNLLMIVRHAHRMKERGHLFDNGISQIGQDQVRQLTEYLNKRFWPSDLIIESSPKLRCQETVQPFAETHSRRIELNANLDEGGDIDAKVRALSSKYLGENLRTARVVCSHGDLIPELILQLTGQFMDLDKGGLAELEWEAQGRPKLVRVIQQW